MCNDDFRVDCQRKGNGDHELVAGVAGTSSDDYPGQAGALLPVVVSYTVLGIPFSFSVIHVIWVTILYVVLALALGLLISTIASTQVSALLVSGVMFMIPVVLLSGMIFPVENMPLALQWFSCIIPARWYISAMRVLMIQQLPIGYVLTEVLVLSGMALAVLVLAVKKFNAKK